MNGEVGLNIWCKACTNSASDMALDKAFIKVESNPTKELFEKVLNLLRFRGFITTSEFNDLNWQKELDSKQAQIAAWRHAQITKSSERIMKEGLK
jgi:acetolactate synthase regulatory subunit